MLNASDPESMYDLELQRSTREPTRVACIQAAHGLVCASVH